MKQTLTIKDIPYGWPYMKGNCQNKWEWVHGEYKCGGDTVCTTVRQVIDGMCDLGNSGEESIILTSDGTVADRRGRREGHHFSGGGVKQARDVSARVRMRQLIWRTLLIIIIIITADSINYWQKKQRYEVYIVKNRMWYPVVTSRTVCTEMSDSLPVVTVLLTFSTARK